MVRKCRKPVGRLPQELVEFIVGFAERNAVAVAAFLDLNECCPVQSDGVRLRFSREFLLELAAVIQLGVWERDGFAAHIEDGLPSYVEAAEELLNRSTREESAVAECQARSLSSRVVEVCWRRFSWEAESILGRPVAVGATGDDELAMALATFLWNNRQRLSALGEGDGQ